MTSIHGIVYLIIGATVSTVSYFLTQGGKNLIVFFWIGMFFLIYGVLKLTFLFLASQRETKKKNPKIHLANHQNINSNKHIHNNNPNQAHLQNQKINCPRCNVHLNGNYRFCPSCGLQLRR
jgi:uncharacterized paraquat-inducible protein A